MKTCDLLVIGGGPAGLSAAIEAASAGVNVFVIDANEKAENDGSLGVSYNYLKNYDFSDGRAYANDLVEIRKGTIQTWTNKAWVRNNKSRAVKPIQAEGTE